MEFLIVDELIYGQKSSVYTEEIVWILRKVIIDIGALSLNSDNTGYLIKQRLRLLSGTIFLTEKDKFFSEFEKLDSEGVLKCVIVEDLFSNEIQQFVEAHMKEHFPEINSVKLGF